jgi:hypothetical protein
MQFRFPVCGHLCVPASRFTARAVPSASATLTPRWLHGNGLERAKNGKKRLRDDSRNPVRHWLGRRAGGSVRCFCGGPRPPVAGFCLLSLHLVSELEVRRPGFAVARKKMTRLRSGLTSDHRPPSKGRVRKMRLVERRPTLDTQRGWRRGRTTLRQVLGIVHGCAIPSDAIAPQICASE